MYGGMIGRKVQEVPTPSMLLDIGAAERNIARMATALKSMPAEIRPHIKVHKSTELSARQVEAGAIGLSVATVWEAAALAWAGLDNLFVVNMVSHPLKIRFLAELARDRHVLVAVDEVANAGELSAACKAAGSQLGVMIEVDTGMDRAGVDAEDQAINLAKEVLALDGIRLEGITGYEGHCSLEFDEQLLIVKQRAGDGHVPFYRRALGVPRHPLSDPVRRRHCQLETHRGTPRGHRDPGWHLCPYGQLPRSPGARWLRASGDDRHNCDQSATKPPHSRRGQQVNRRRRRTVSCRLRPEGAAL